MSVQRRSVDVEEVRARHPLADVVAAAGIELHQRGHGYVGCCPFHDDATPSFSVDGVPDRFHCFGCGASGDVIDFVCRTRNLGFLEAVAELDGDRYRERSLSVLRPRHHLRAVPQSAIADIATSRAFEINQLAWEHFATPVGAGFATHYLQHRRGIDLEPLTRAFGGQIFVGHATHGWSSLTDHLRSQGVDDDELLGMDLAMRTRGSRLIDTYRNRLIIPITNDRNQIRGFIGRDISGHPAAPKYRNPTHTPVFDKSQVLYRPTRHALSPDAQVLVVEGALDALAVAAAAAAVEASSRVAVCSTNGVAVSPTQVDQVLAMTHRPPRIAFDGDPAGQHGTTRWLDAACIERRAPVLVSRLPSGADPADWLAARGPNGLGDLFARPSNAHDPEVPHTVVPGRQLIQLLLDRVDDPIRDAVDTIAALAAQLPPTERAQLLRDSTSEMTRHGWNPRDAYAKALEDAMRRPPTAVRATPFIPVTPSLI
ncbi:CHC2 zinc finger domain-containing protein [Terrabacter sp. Soil810]|uniref:CHC2 zinc finger domain-containing protein n=1 Tax=Terrabacter sp. Soil810 TaxID=1736418 RepID=UPI0007090A5C|nr:CHC2 zinc finger domain-containing protein [Terrabacter sp. Soil810]KRF35528.1 hypothetical protein ASG96_19085 [Terrabacter sp. Soil810]